MRFIGRGSAAARGREPGRHRSPTSLTPNTTNPTPHPTADEGWEGKIGGACKSKRARQGRWYRVTGRNVDRRATLRLVGCSTSNECVPTHQSWQEGAGAADAQEAGQEKVGVGDVDRKEQVMTNREGGKVGEGGGGWEWNEWGHQRGAITTDCCP